MHRTEYARTRLTPAEKMSVEKKTAEGNFKNQSDFFKTALNLLIADDSGLFANVSRHFNDSYTISNEEQYQQLKEAYEELRHACYLLTKLTDNYDQEKAPAEYKNVLRDYLLPRLYSTLQKYEDENSVPLTDRLTDQASEM